MPLTEEEKRKIEEEETYRQNIRSGKVKPSIAVKPKQSVDIKNIGKLFLILCAITFWPITPVVYPIWLLHKKTKLPIKKKIIISSSWVLVLFIILQLSWYVNRAPIIEILEPVNNFSTWDETITIKGKVAPSYAVTSVNSGSISIEDGNFTINAKLPIESNVFIVTATNGGKTQHKSVTVVRQLTEAQKAEIIKAQEEAEAKRQADLEANRKAEQKRLKEEQAKKDAAEKAWISSTAGQICSQHPEWTKEDCIALSERQIWVGMTYQMAVYLRGNPNSINPSNYGGGNRYQCCWHDYKPSCFYDHNDDGVIDAYN